jgi:hypothetical protein
MDVKVLLISKEGEEFSIDADAAKLSKVIERFVSFDTTSVDQFLCRDF